MLALLAISISRAHAHIIELCDYLEVVDAGNVNFLLSLTIFTSPTGSVAIVKYSSNDTYLFLQFSFFPCFYTSLSFAHPFLPLNNLHSLQFPQFMPLTMYLLKIWSDVLNSYIVNYSFKYHSQIFQDFFLSTRMHTLVPSDFLLCFCCCNNRLSSSLSRSLWPIIEDKGRPGFVCLVCRIHFPEGEQSPIRAARLSSRLWQDLTCPPSPVIAFKWQTMGPNQFWSIMDEQNNHVYTYLNVHMIQISF